ncbi:hypothetical protein NDU88_003645 [Pleurodeles waltl]|uniref:Basic proline-rich protein-like n=1 Tax=Pleurodeles waltl TaxID=8319 RepID=A0AAV7Q9J8_PLEWA|nr:hypothetical protein NDU88_003645 [Pleurodeles waltl]
MGQGTSTADGPASLRRPLRSSTPLRMVESGAPGPGDPLPGPLSGPSGDSPRPAQAQSLNPRLSHRDPLSGCQAGPLRFLSRRSFPGDPRANPQGQRVPEPAHLRPLPQPSQAVPRPRDPGSSPALPCFRPVRGSGPQARAHPRPRSPHRLGPRPPRPSSGRDAPG